MPELRTTFIPKTPASTTTAAAPPKTVNIFVLAASLVFVFSLAAAGGAYFYRAILVRDIEELSRSVARAEEIVSPALVSRLSAYEKRARAVKTLLDTHIVLSPVFDLLEALAISSVRFSDFEYSLGREGNAKLALSGEAKSYSALAAQSNLLGKSEYIKEPIFSNFALNTIGNVTFDFSAGVEHSFQLYRNTLAKEAPVAAPPAEAKTETEEGETAPAGSQ